MDQIISQLQIPEDTFGGGYQIKEAFEESEKIKTQRSSNKELFDKLEQDRNDFMIVFDEESEEIYSFTEWKYRELLIFFEKLDKQMKMMEQMADYTYEERIIVTWNMGQNIKEKPSEEAVESFNYKSLSEIKRRAFRNKFQILQ